MINNKSIPLNLLSILFFTFVLTTSLFTSETVQAKDSILLPNSSFDLQITPYLFTFEDATNQLTINDILTDEYQLNFNQNKSDNLRFKISGSSYWIRFSVSNPYEQDKNVFFSISNHFLENVSFYEYKAGELHNLSRDRHDAHSHKTQFYPFLIEVNKKQKQTYFIKIQSSSLINSTFWLQSDDQFLAHQKFDFTIQGMVISWILAICNFFIFIWYFYRFKISILSALYGLSILIFIPAWLNHWSVWFPALQNWRNEIIIFSLISSILLQIQIVMKLDWPKAITKQTTRILNTLLIINALVTLICIFLPSGLMVALIKITIISNCLTVIGLLYVFRSNNPQAQTSLLISYSLIAFGVTVSLLIDFDFISIDVFYNLAELLLPLIMVNCMLICNLSLVKQYNNDKQYKENKNLALTELITKLAYEVRTPINGIVGMSELLSETHLSPTQKEYTDSINLSADHLSNFSNDISDFTKIQGGHLTLEQYPFDLTHCLTKCLTRYQQEANRKNIELVLDISDNISHHVLGDKNRLETIINHLLGQSLRHTESGELELSVFQVEKSSLKGIFFQIQLTGSFIEHEELQRLFRTMPEPQEALTLLHDNQKLGLIIAKQLIKLMNGSIEVETLTYQGCSITLFLPLEEVLSDKIKPTSQSLAGKRILIVDDNAIFREVIKKQTKRWGMKADSTYSGKEALALMRIKANLGEHYDFIIIDQDMPIMDGLQLAQRLSTDNNITPKPKSIMLSTLGQSHFDPSDFGIRQVVNKPISGRYLKDILLKL